MSEIFDMLTLSKARSPRFTVNTSVNSVDVTMLSGVNAFKNIVSSDTFQGGDNFTLLSAGYYIPEGFTMATPALTSAFACPVLNLNLWDVVDGAPYIISPFMGIFLPMENYELSINHYANHANYITNPYQINLVNFQLDPVHKPQVSMQNVPSALNGTTQFITVFLKVIHNLVMT
jgi:hypothetical protein